MDAKAVLTSMLAEADIRVGGGRPWDIRIHNEGLYKRVLREGSLGAGEAYLVINGMKSSGKKRDNLGSIGKNF